mgnify:CR=1 FL=1|jgi:hypothetical protein
MKYLKCFESFEKEWSELSDKEKRELQYNSNSIPVENSNPYYDELINDIIKNHEMDMSSSFDDIEEGKEYLYSFLNYDFNILPEKFKLYRVVVADDKNDIDLHNIGSHYVLDKRLLSDSDFLYDIGVTSIDNSKIDKLWCVEVVVKKSDVDIKTTLINRFMYPNEEEITLNKNYKPISYNVEKIELY